MLVLVSNAPNFGKVEKSYCFGLVRLSVRPSLIASFQDLLRYSFEISYMDFSSKNNCHVFFLSLDDLPLWNSKGHNDL